MSSTIFKFIDKLYKQRFGIPIGSLISLMLDETGRFKIKAPIAGRLRKCHSIFFINRSKCDAESRIAAIILMYVSSLL